MNMTYLSKNKYIFIIAAIPLFLLIFTFISTSRVAAASYNGTNYLMSDSVFLANGTMSANQIQSFLVSEGSGLSTFSDVESCGNDSQGAMMAIYAPYFSCGTSQPASQIIYDASQAYGINPQVLLATIQKEQSLVTTPNPTSSQLDCAAGFESCGVSGFFNQVAWAAWQFRYDYEAINGNSYGGYSSSSYPCNGPTNYYSEALKPGNDVTFYDSYGNPYTAFVMPNASTSTLYCYTPHVYPGSSQEYYSGSYNFDYYFNLWFVPFQASYVSQSPYPTLVQGQSSSAFIEYQNDGNEPWYDDVSAPQYNTYPVHLATSNPINYASPFADSSWPTNDRPSGTFAAVYNSDGTTLATNQHVAQPGQIVKFDFTLTAQSGLYPGYYQEFFQPILEGSNMWNMGGEAWLGITVN